MTDDTPQAAPHSHGDQPCDPSEAAAVAQWERDEGPDPRWTAMLPEAIAFRRDRDYLSGGDMAWRYMQAWRDVDFLLRAASLVPAPPDLAGLRVQLLAIPLGAGGITSAGWNRYDTDDEYVLHLWSGTWEPSGQSWDIRVPKVRAAASPATPPEHDVDAKP